MFRTAALLANVTLNSPNRRHSDRPFMREHAVACVGSDGHNLRKNWRKGVREEVGCRGSPAFNNISINS